MTNPRDPEGLMPDAPEPGPPVGPDGELTGAGLTSDGGALDSGLDQAALADRTDTDEFGSDPDMRFPGDSEDPTMTTADQARSGETGVPADDAMG